MDCHFEVLVFFPLFRFLGIGWCRDFHRLDLKLNPINFLKLKLHLEPLWPTIRPETYLLDNSWTNVPTQACDLNHIYGQTRVDQPRRTNPRKPAEIGCPIHIGGNWWNRVNLDPTPIDRVLDSPCWTEPTLFDLVRYDRSTLMISSRNFRKTEKKRKMKEMVRVNTLRRVRRA